MTIIPVNGTLLVQQSCQFLNKCYETSFPDTKDGLREAYYWANIIALGWHVTQDEDWRAKHAA